MFASIDSASSFFRLEFLHYQRVQTSSRIIQRDHYQVPSTFLSLPLIDYMTYMSEAQLTMTGVQLTSSPEKVLASIADVKELNDSSVTNAGVLSAILRGFELPKIYVQPDVERKGKVHLDEDIQLPSVDLSVFRLAEDDPRRKESLATIVNSCKTWGFIQVVGHGVDLHMIKRCEAEAHRLFDLPVSVKEKVLRVPGALYGYGSNFFRNLTAMNWAESFHISHANVREYAAKLWPTEYEQFRYL